MPLTGNDCRAAALAEREKGEASLRAAEALRPLGLHDDAASRLYWAVFHLVCAALILRGTEPTSHQAAQTLFSRDLVKPGLVPKDSARLFAGLMGLRHQVDYNREFCLDRTGADAEFASAGPLITALRTVLVTSGVGS